MILKNMLIISGQMVIHIIFLVLVIPLIYMEIPGYGAICDSNQVILFVYWIILIPFSFGIIINSLHYLKRGKWTTYRILSILIVSCFILFAIRLRPLIFQKYYGKEENALYGVDPVFIKIQLFENGTFFARTSDLNCESENTGQYTYSHNILVLDYANEKSAYLGTTYEINNNRACCLNCVQFSQLEIKN